jgi:hypothetical protein
MAVVTGNTGHVAETADVEPSADPSAREDSPEVTLWAMLAVAPPAGIATRELMAVTGTSRPTLPGRTTVFAASAPSRTRTCGLLLRRQSLYPPELSGPTLPGGHPPQDATRSRTKPNP